MTGTLAKFFDDVAAGVGLGPPVDRTWIRELRTDLAHQLDDIAAALTPAIPPVVLTKGRIRAVLACETGALAREENPSELTPPLMLGHLLDRVIAGYVVNGAVPADPFSSAVEAVQAERDERVMAWLDAATPSDVDTLRVDLEARAGRVGAWPPIDAQWWPRLEDRVSLAFADGRLRLSGRFDLLLGGGPTPLPRIVVEVKAGNASSVHQPDLYWYALLSALRDDVCPRAVAVWSGADGATTASPVSAGALESAALRTIAAAKAWVDLATGRAPTLTGHSGCRWCPRLEECSTGQAWTPDA